MVTLHIYHTTDDLYTHVLPYTTVQVHNVLGRLSVMRHTETVSEGEPEWTRCVPIKYRKIPGRRQHVHSGQMKANLANPTLFVFLIARLF